LASLKGVRVAAVPPEGTISLKSASGTGRMAASLKVQVITGLVELPTVVPTIADSG
jgi:hypothetical protein